MRNTPRRCLTLLVITIIVLMATPVRAWHISGQVLCDANGNSMSDGPDTPINGVGVLITSVTLKSGTFPTTTDSGNGSFLVTLPEQEDSYQVELTTGLPGGASVIVPAGGVYGMGAIAPIHLQPSAFDGVANFLVNGCLTTPTRTATLTPTPTRTATPSPTHTTVAPTPTSSPTVASSTASPTAPATPTATPTPVSGDFQCYEVDRSTVGKIVGLDVVDRYGGATIDLAAGKPVKRLCNPADVDDADPAAPTASDHLVGYVISNRTPRFDSVAGQEVVTTFGSVVLTVVRPVALLVPSAKSLTGHPGPITPTIDHYLCYSVMGGQSSAKGVDVVDQFGAHTFDLKRPARLCVAADKETEGVPEPDAALLCYAVRPATSADAFRGPVDAVYTDNQFGPDTLLVNHGRELCLKATISAVP